MVRRSLRHGLSGDADHRIFTVTRSATSDGPSFRSSIAALDMCAVAEESSTPTRWWRIATRKLGLPGSHAHLHRGRRVVAESAGRDLVTLEHADRRAPLVASTPDLLEALRKAMEQGTCQAPPSAGDPVGVEARDGYPRTGALP